MPKSESSTHFAINELLCSLCRQLIEHILAKDFSTKWPRCGNGADFGFQHHTKEYFQEMNSAYGLDNCPLCQIILESMWSRFSPHPFNGKKKAELPEWHHVWVYVSSDNPDEVLPYPGEILSWKGTDYLWRAMFLHVLQRVGTGPHAVTGEYILPELPKGAPFADIRSWVDDCVNCRNGHDQCERKKPALPTRVIDVESNPPKVVVSNGTSEPYVALSHCWGGLIETRLLHETYSAFTSKGIPEEKLPPTFRDAIFVVRQLNIRWIWIDALCIIQDDANDWEQEAQLMSNVYEGAVFVLSAYSTPGSKSGLGFRRAACVASLQGGEEVYVQRELIDIFDTPDPLGSRGWSLQEHALAFAVLEIGRGRIKWTCPAGCYSENDPKSLRTNRANDAVVTLATIDSSTNSQERAWRHVVTNYTQRDLTFEGDKMAALAGVATTFGAGLPRFADSSRITYVAGLWKETFLKDLMWTTNPYETIIPRRERAPSWSWVALDGPVTWRLLDMLERPSSVSSAYTPDEKFYPFCDIDFPSLELSNTSKAAKTNSGQVSFSGLLVFLTELPVRRPDVHSVGLSRRDKVIEDDRFFDESLKKALLGAPESSTRSYREMRGSIDRDTEAPCWALRLAGTEEREQFDTLFMMLEEVQKNEVGATSNQVFRRVGMLLVSIAYEPVTIPRLLDDPYYRGMWSGEVAKVTVI